MYAQRLKYGRIGWSHLSNQFRIQSRPLGTNYYSHPPCQYQIVFANSSIKRFSLPTVRQVTYTIKGSEHHYKSSRCFCSKGDGSNGANRKHESIRGQDNVDKVDSKEEVASVSARCEDHGHAQLGEQDHKEWLSGKRYNIECKKKESPFLTKRQRYKNEFLRRVIPWKKISLSWANFPYYINANSKELLVECASSHLRQRNFASSYGSRLASGSGRILLQSMPGTELYRERLVKALARELEVSLLVLDYSVVAPFDLEQNLSSESEDENESGEECSASELEDENEEDWSSSNESKATESDDDDSVPSVAVLKRIIPCSVEEFAKRVVAASEDSSTSESSETAKSADPETKSFQKGDRVKYVGSSVVVEADQRINLGKISTPEGPVTAYTFISGRTISNGFRGEVYEVNGDQVAVIFDVPERAVDNSNEDGNELDSMPFIYWIDIQNIVRDYDVQSEDWYIAMEALCEVLPSLEPVIVYFPDGCQWLSRAVTKSNRKEFVQKVEEMLDFLKVSALLVCGQDISEIAPKEKEKFTMVLPSLGRVARLPLPLKQLTDGLKGTKSRPHDLSKLFTNKLFIPLPKEERELMTFNSQIEEDRKLIVSRHNLTELHKVLEEHELSCLELLQVNVDGLFLTRKKAERVAGWARNHYLSSIALPSVEDQRLLIPRESLEVALQRLREQEGDAKKPIQNLKALAKDEHESNFVSAVVPPDEIGVKFEDIGALEDVKKTLDELVTLPMRRPELFSHGNLLRPCRGVLLFGPPGTGKTLLAKALATEAGANFISITGSSLTSKWFGDAEKLTKALFSFAARLAPVIIFVDEVDSLLGSRGGFEHEATRRMKNEFMAAWDGLRSKDTQRIIVLAATNRPFDLDDAVIRRLPRRIYVDLPDAGNREKILKVILAKENLEPEFGYRDLANATEGYSGSDLKNLCIAAAYRPVQEILEEEKLGKSRRYNPRSLRLDDFIESKTKVSPSVAYDAISMNELRKWNEQYGEGGSRSRSSFGFAA